MSVIDQTVKPEFYHTDLLTVSQKVRLLLRVPMFKGYTYIAISIIVLIFPFALFFLLPLLLMMLAARPSYEFPSRAPFQSKIIDKSDRKESGKGFHLARGELYLGWHRGTGKELWVSWDDLLTHLYMLAATGGGKSQAIWTILCNFYCAGSAYSLGDGKGTLEMVQHGRVLARIFGVEDDYFVVNYISPNPKKKHKLMSNTLNTWSQGTAAQLKEQMASLALSGDAGTNQYFEDNAEVIIERVFPAFVELRDKGVLTLDIQAIGKYLSLTNLYQLSLYPQLSSLSRSYITDYLQTIGFNFDTPSKQSDEVIKQYGQFVTHFSKVISSLSIQYRSIYVVDQGEINQKDITSNRRTLIFALPSLEKSGAELKNLGNILLTGQKNAISTDLGDELEGTTEKTTARLSKNYRVPYALSFDEWAFYAIKDMALLPAQIRGLKYFGLYAAQDYAGTERAGEMDAEQVFANTRVKLFGALEEAGKSWTRIRDLMGEFLVAVNSNYKYLPGLFGGRKIIDHERTEITKRAPIEIGDLQKQISGEFFLFQRGKLSPIRFFHINLDGYEKEAVKGNGFKINRLCRVYAPSDEAIQEIDRNEQFINVMFSSGRIFSELDALAPLKRQLASYQALGNPPGTIEHVDALTTFVEENALRFGLKLIPQKRITYKPVVVAQVPDHVEPVAANVLPETSNVAPTVDVIIPELVSGSSPLAAESVETLSGGVEGFDSDGLLDGFFDISGDIATVAAENATPAVPSTSEVNPPAAETAAGGNYVESFLAQHTDLSASTVAAKLKIMSQTDVNVNGAHILSDNEANRIRGELTIINNLLGFNYAESTAIAQRTVNNLHRYCYYLAPPKPNTLKHEIVSELSKRVDNLLAE